MPINVDIFEFKCFNQLRNGADYSLNTSEFTPNLVGNIGERLKVSFKASILQTSYAEGAEQWTVYPALNEIVRTSGSFLDDRVQVGDKFEFYADWGNRKTTSTEYNGTVSFLSNDGLTLRYTVDSGTEVTTGAVSNVGLAFDQLNATNLNTALFLKFGLIGNDETFNYQSKTTEAAQVYYKGGLVSTVPAVAESLGTIKDWVTGSATFTLQAAALDWKDAVYLVEHEFILNPFYIIAYRQFIDAGSIPDILAGDNSLKYAAELEFRKTLTNTGSSKLKSFDNLDGFVGWYAENFNGLNAKYRVKSVTFEETVTGDPLDGININLSTKAIITVENLAGPITDYNCGVYLFRVPTSEAQYIGTISDLVDNFLFKSETITGPATNSANVTTAIVAGELVITYTIDYTTAEKLQLTTDDEFILLVQVEDPTISAGNSDRVMLIASLANFTEVNWLDAFVDVPRYRFLLHSQNLTDDLGQETVRVSVEDGILLNALVGVDVTRNAVINDISLKLIALNAVSGNSFELDSYNLNIGPVVFDAGLQQIEVETTRGYPLPDNDEFNLVRVTTEGLTGDFQRFKINVGQKLKWQDWILNPGVDPVFFDATKLNNNLNYKSSNYSDVANYQIKVALVVNVTGEDDLGRSVTGDYVYSGNDLVVDEYDESSDGVSGVIETFDLETGVSLSGGILYNGKDTLFKALFENAAGMLYGIHRIEPSQNSGDGILELSSVMPSVPGNLLKPISGETLLKYTLAGTDVTTECLIDGSKIQEGINYKLSARILNPIPPTTIYLTTNWNVGADGNLQLELPGAGSTTQWIFSDDSVLTGASIDTNKALLNGTDQIITIIGYFENVTEIDFEDKKIRALDLTEFVFGDLFTSFRLSNPASGVTVLDELTFPVGVNYDCPITSFILEAKKAASSTLAGGITTLDLSCFSNLRTTITIRSFGALTSIVFNDTIKGNAFSNLNFFYLVGHTNALDLSGFTDAAACSFVGSAFSDVVIPNNFFTVLNSVNFTNCTGLNANIDFSHLTNKLGGSILFNGAGAVGGFTVSFPSTNVLLTALNFTNSKVSGTVNWSVFSTFGAATDIVFDTCPLLTGLTNPASLQCDEFRLNGSAYPGVLDASFIDVGICRVFQVQSNAALTGIIMPSVNITIIQITNNDNASFNLLDISGNQLNPAPTNFLIDENANLSAVTFMAGLQPTITGANGIQIRNNPAFTSNVPLGSVLVSVTNRLESNAISGAALDAMISTLNTNKANYPAGAKSLNIGNAGMGTPSGGSIAIMTSLAATDDWTFTYWNGASNTVIT